MRQGGARGKSSELHGVGLRTAVMSLLLVCAISIGLGACGFEPAASSDSSGAAKSAETADNVADDAPNDTKPDNSPGDKVVDAKAETQPSNDEAAIGAEPEASNADYSSLQSEIESIVEASNIDVGVQYINLDGTAPDDGFGVNGDRRLVSASMIKLLILAAFLDQVDEGKLDMEEPYTIEEGDIVGGTGSIQGRGAGAQYTLADLAYLMISESDNVAANVLIERLGMDAINREASKLGLEHTEINRAMMDEAAISQHVENFMSAHDAAKILAAIWRGELVSEQASEFALHALEAQTDSMGLAAGIPGTVAFAHKTGTLALVRNDAGIVEAEKPYVIAVFCAGGEQSAALNVMETVSRAVFEWSQGKGAD